MSLFVSPRASSQEDDKAPKQAQSSGSKAAASTDGSGLSCQSQSASLKLGEICSTHAALSQYLDVLRGSISHLICMAMYLWLVALHVVVSSCPPSSWTQVNLPGILLVHRLGIRSEVSRSM